MEQKTASTSDAVRDFHTTPLAQRLTRHHHHDPRAAALALFHAAAARVPAYGEFLHGHGIAPDNIRDHDGFRQLPLMTKADYMLPYPLPARCWDGRLEISETLAVSSGSTGRPMFWPRSIQHELDIAYRFEHIFRDAFNADRATTLAVVCFPMGTWVGGMYTATCCRYLAQKGYPVTVVTPGNKHDEIYRIVEELGPHFEQVVLIGYPPFVKDVIDQGASRGLDWPRYRIKLVFAGEVFTEEWRELVCRRAGAEDPQRDTAALYGTADAGVLGNETPLSIAIRRHLAHHPEAARELFGESRLPTLVQYDPLSRFFEVHDGTLVLSGDNGVPLVRYHIADQGGIIAHDDMLRFMREQGVTADDLPAPRDEDPSLPFVYLFGRADFTVSFYGANIYPENVSVGLEQPEITDRVTGKFVLQVRASETGDAYLAVAVELLPEIAPDEAIRHAVADSIHRHLMRINSEFANYVPPAKQIPAVSLHATGDPDYFPVGVKHRYTRNSDG